MASNSTKHCTITQINAFRPFTFPVVAAQHCNCLRLVRQGVEEAVEAKKQTQLRAEVEAELQSSEAVEEPAAAVAVGPQPGSIGNTRDSSGILHRQRRDPPKGSARSKLRIVLRDRLLKHQSLRRGPLGPESCGRCSCDCCVDHSGNCCGRRNYLYRRSPRSCIRRGRCCVRSHHDPRSHDLHRSRAVGVGWL